MDLPTYTNNDWDHLSRPVRRRTCKMIAETVIGVIGSSMAWAYHVMDTKHVKRVTKKLKGMKKGNSNYFGKYTFSSQISEMNIRSKTNESLMTYISSYFKPK
jgi:hypothetical protein